MKPAILRSQHQLFARRIYTCALACAVLLAASGSAQANSFCVSTAQQLQDALTASSDGGMYGGETNFINVIQGTYKIGSATSNGPFHYSNSTMGVHFILEGGYDATCTTQTHKASLTVLDGNHSNQVLTIHSTNGPVTVAWFTIQNGESSSRGALSINGSLGDNSSASVIDNIIQNNHTTGLDGGLGVGAGGSGHVLVLQNNLIVGNSADLGDGAGELVGNGSETLIYNNTVTQNTTPASGGTGGLKCNGGAICIAVNNIFWNNTNYGLYLSSSGDDVEYNDYGILGGQPPGTSQGNVSVAPKFVNANGGDFHLAGDSPLLGASPQIFGTFDVDGNSYPVNGNGDLGAYEETIFIDGFDGG